ncbi:pectate lyase C [Seiridium cupressi]
MGSFRDAVSADNRIVVVDTAPGGVCAFDQMIIHVRYQSLSNFTKGITIYGNGLSFSNSDNAIIRYVRFRMGASGDSGKDGVTIAEGENMIFDQVSVTWGRDETFNINGNVYNVPIKNSIIGQGLETHSCGGLIQTDYGVSLIRNLYIDNKTRNSKVKGMNDFQDNNGALNGSALCVKATCYADMDILTTNYDYPGPNTLMTATTTVTWVLNNVGANYPSRDSVDKRLVSGVQTWGTTGELISDETASPMYGPGYIASGTRPTEMDGDGIPDVWEQANGLDYQDASDTMAITLSRSQELGEARVGDSVFWPELFTHRDGHKRRNSTVMENAHTILFNSRTTPESGSSLQSNWPGVGYASHTTVSAMHGQDAASTPLETDLYGYDDSNALGLSALSSDYIVDYNLDASEDTCLGYTTNSEVALSVPFLLSCSHSMYPFENWKDFPKSIGQYLQPTSTLGMDKFYIHADPRAPYEKSHSKTPMVLCSPTTEQLADRDVPTVESILHVQQPTFLSRYCQDEARGSNDEGCSLGDDSLTERFPILRPGAIFHRVILDEAYPTGDTDTATPRLSPEFRQSIGGVSLAHRSELVFRDTFKYLAQKHCNTSDYESAKKLRELLGNAMLRRTKDSLYGGSEG